MKMVCEEIVSVIVQFNPNEHDFQQQLFTDVLQIMFS